MQSVKDNLKEFEKDVQKLTLDELDLFRHKLKKSDERVVVIEKRIDDLICEQFKSEELNKRLEQRYKSQKRITTLAVKIVCAILLIIAFFSYLKGWKPYESFRAFCVGCAALVYGVVSIVENRFSFFFDLYHRKAYPTKYWLSVCSLFILGFFCIVVLGLHGPK